MYLNYLDPQLSQLDHCRSLSTYICISQQRTPDRASCN